MTSFKTINQVNRHHFVHTNIDLYGKNKEVKRSLKLSIKTVHRYIYIIGVHGYYEFLFKYCMLKIFFKWFLTSLFMTYHNKNHAKNQRDPFLGKCQNSF